MVVTFGIFAQQYVDLGLPSGTLWKDQNEKGHYTYQEAEKSFGKGMPTAPQLSELGSYCTWEWTGNGYKITGPNGKSIFFPAEGYYTCENAPTVKFVGEKGQYWSRTVSDNNSIAFPEWKFPFCLSISSESKDVYSNNPDCCKFSVHLVSENESAVTKAKILQQLAESETQAKRSEAEEQKIQEEEQKKQEELNKIESEAKRKEEEEKKRLEAECISLRDIDGNQYALVMVGSQCWMRENLRTTHYADGVALSVGKPLPSCYSSLYSCYYPNEDPANVAISGYLYNWKTVTRGLKSSKKNPIVVQGICPAGWHVPSYDEWKDMLSYISSQEQYLCGNKTKNIAKAMSSSAGWMTSSKHCSAGNNASDNNATGFNVYPAGYYFALACDKCRAYDFGKTAVFWTSTEGMVDYGKALIFWYDDPEVNTYTDALIWKAFSVRCIRGVGLLGNAVSESASVSTEDIQTRKAQNIQSTISILNSLLRVTTTVIDAVYSPPATYNNGVDTYPAGTSENDSYNTSTSSSDDDNIKSKSAPRTCTMCNGTGKVIKDSGAAQFGLTEKYCEICGKKVPGSHMHGQCPACRGKGHM